MTTQKPITNGWLTMLMQRGDGAVRPVFFIPPRGKKWRAGYLFAQDGDRLQVGVDAPKHWVHRDNVAAR